ncbi:broad-complex core protein isoform X2 [Culex quinquefasciatus]|uniref:broad-complex core protein isoform X2 n=1 Tax=Culex quinquefasciatus TaxID=7176 RepID=UPI0018E317E3|nr:broad-complex core protein isoform X2 [Culex quinquefasciatus]
MGSEHYCLRWNNHQSNLLGVFSQLLQDESLVDVTLACSEGASIRAHKVVLSACSSYFQTLFLDHPARHPIVILKDVRFAELRTLVDFMYKGEVNVEYCQLSALLKTAESLKVKGLAEQSTALAEPKRDPDRLRPQSHSSAQHATSLTTSAASPSAVPTSGAGGTTTLGGGSPHQQQQLGSPTSNAAASIVAAAASLGITDLSTTPMGKSRGGLDPDGRSPSPSRLDPPSPTPLALYPPLRKSRDHHPTGSSVSSSATTTITTAAATTAERSSEERDLEHQHHLHLQQQSRPQSNSGNAFSSTLNSLSSTVERLNNSNNNAGMSSSSSALNDSGNLRLRQRRNDDDDDDDDDDDEDMEENGERTGISLNSKQDALLQHCHRGDDDGRRSSTNNNNNNSDDDYEPPIKIKSEVGLNMTINSPACLANSTTTSGLVNSSALGDLRPSSRDSGGRGGGTPVACSSTTLATGGNGGTPLALDRSSPRSQRDRNERSTFGSGGIPSPLSEPIAGPSGMGPVQQVPLSLKKEIDWDRGDDKSSGDSSLDFRHPHDSNLSHLFATAATGNYSRAAGIKSAPATAAATAAAGIIGFPGAAVGAIPFVFPFAPLGLGLFDTDPKRILNLLHHQSALAEEALRYRNLLFGTSTSTTASNSSDRDTPIHLHPESPSPKPQDRTKPDYTEQPSTSRLSDTGTESSTITSPPPPSPSPSSLPKLDPMIRVRDGLTKEGFHNGMELLLRKPAAVEEPADLSLYSSLMKGAGEGASPGESTKCHICMANFPSVWLLEQHAALQHPHLTIHDDKPYLCGLCGQKSRYTCCRYRTVLAKHREQASRSRVPADKLFTCDVCGMQFRYLKSFKKHRLNHALERLHGKKDKQGGGQGGESEQVSSTNESDSVDLRGLVRDEENLSDNDEQDDTVDSMHAGETREFVGDGDGQGKISSSMMESSGGSSEFDFKKYQSVHRMAAEAESSSTSSSIPSTSSNSLSATLNTLINAESIPHHQLLGLNPQEASILNYLRVDAAEKQRDRRFACPFCGKCVRSKENLKLHVRKHTGERPFVCLFCGRAFGGKSDLTRHLRIHTGERPYHCEACGKCFARADYLSKHLTTHVHNASPR